MTHEMRNLLSVLAACLLSISAAGAAKAECGKVIITEMNWAPAAIVTSVSKFLMEQGYGCDVQVLNILVAPAITSIAEKGEPDIVTELWINSAPKYDELEAAGTVVTLANVLTDGGIGGIGSPTIWLQRVLD